MTTDPAWFVLEPHRTVPNNILPVLFYAASLPASAQRIEAAFSVNGWSGAWVNGIYPFHHFHSNAHEVLGCAGGSASVQLGGEDGRKVEIGPGDVLVLPAGVGHKRLSPSTGLLIVGAYPAGCACDLIAADDLDPLAFQEAERRIAAVPLPETDPVFGTGGPLVRLWREVVGR